MSRATTDGVLLLDCLGRTDHGLDGPHTHECYITREQEDRRNQEWLDSRRFKNSPLMTNTDVKARFLAEALANFDGSGIDFAQYDVEIEADPDELDVLIIAVVWTHKTTGFQIMLDNIWFDEETGGITQCGSNYGRLTL